VHLNVPRQLVPQVCLRLGRTEQVHGVHLFSDARLCVTTRLSSRSSHSSKNTKHLGVMYYILPQSAIILIIFELVGSHRVGLAVARAGERPPKTWWL
jgi:hypothetical protein